MGGKLHLKLNTGERPIANKYREGKMKRTLKRESKVLEIVNREAIERQYSGGGHSGVGRRGGGAEGRASYGVRPKPRHRGTSAAFVRLSGSASVVRPLQNAGGEVAFRV